MVVVEGKVVVVVVVGTVVVDVVGIDLHMHSSQSFKSGSNMATP